LIKEYKSQKLFLDSIFEGENIENM